MQGDSQLNEVRKFFGADSPLINIAREEISEAISEMLDIGNIDTAIEVSAEGLALEVKARKLASEKLKAVFTRLGFDLKASAKESRKHSFR